MFEETNQTEIPVEDTNLQEQGILPYSLFEEGPEQGITVKYNGEEKTISLAEAKTLAQKGMNYDRIYEKCSDLTHTLDAIAAKQGILRGELISGLNGEDVHRLRWEGLLKAYPDLDIEALPDEIFTRVDDGMSPIEAYQSHLITQLKMKIRNEENEMRSIGSIESLGEAPRDNFLDGFLGAKY